jgi:hypothetical protein
MEPLGEIQRAQATFSRKERTRVENKDKTRRPASVQSARDLVDIRKEDNLGPSSFKILNCSTGTGLYVFQLLHQYYF